LCTGAAAALSEIQILSLDERKEAYFCKPVDVSKPNQCNVVNLADVDLPASRDGYAAASTVYTFEGSTLKEPAITTLVFLYGGEATPPDPNAYIPEDDHTVITSTPCQEHMQWRAAVQPYHACTIVHC
jgi:hypothetical protein